MFEKDEDYRKARKESKDRITKVIKAWCAREEVIHDKGFEQGVEFGYNKAKIEVEESYKESLCNSELNLASVTEQLEELKKANEWHVLEENPNVLPTENMKPSLVKDVFGNLIVAYYSLELKSWWGTPEPDFGIEYEIPVVKWKEIVDD